MSCGLVGPDFMDKYFEHEDSDVETDEASSDADTLLDDGDGSDTLTEVESDLEDVEEFDPYQVIYIDLQAQNMLWAQLAQAAHNVFQQSAPARLRLAVQGHIVDRIFEFAMHANNNRIVMPRLTGFPANAGIATGTLAINHRLYHVCRNALYRDNEFVVDRHGSGLQYLSQNMGFSTCGFACPRQPRIKSLRLVLGCQDHDQQGVFRCESFTQALKDMTNQITVETLRIDLEPFCFLGNEDLIAFATALEGKIKVKRDFELCGLDVHWEWDLRAVPLALCMRSQPTRCNFKYHNDKQQQVGPFCCKYQRAQNMNEKFGVDTDGNDLEIQDGRYYYKLQQDGVYEETRVLGGVVSHFRQGNGVNFYLFREDKV
ncbi:MAG: hypothetical protein LQ343_001675 [Gyalolechia ehrenbergii]|nr:MAG: hypothetical protein LQ343_001675 [Gyalolechia ehrenbergii]